MWNLPRPGTESVYPASLGGFLSTVSPAKSRSELFSNRTRQSKVEPSNNGGTTWSLLISREEPWIVLEVQLEAEVCRYCGLGPSLLRSQPPGLMRQSQWPVSILCAVIASFSWFAQRNSPISPGDAGFLTHSDVSKQNRLWNPLCHHGITSQGGSQSWGGELRGSRGCHQGLVPTSLGELVRCALGFLNPNIPLSSHHPLLTLWPTCSQLALEMVRQFTEGLNI